MKFVTILIATLLMATTANAACCGGHCGGGGGFFHGVFGCGHGGCSSCQGGGCSSGGCSSGGQCSDGNCSSCQGGSCSSCQGGNCEAGRTPTVYPGQGHYVYMGPPVSSYVWVSGSAQGSAPTPILPRLRERLDSRPVESRLFRRGSADKAVQGPTAQPAASTKTHVEKKSACNCCGKCSGRPGCRCACPNCTCNAKSAGLFEDYSPEGSKTGNILADVRSRCDQQGLQNGYDADKVTCTHESTHMVNSRIRNFLGRPGFYVGGGRAVSFRCHPRVTLAQVAKYVDPSLHNSTYQLYFVQQRQWWDKEPLYVLDEASAYAAGAQAAKELQVDEHGENERARWFCEFSSALVQAVEEIDPTYCDLDKLKEYVAWHTARVQSIIGQPLSSIRWNQNYDRKDAKHWEEIDADYFEGKLRYTWTWLFHA